MSQCSRPTYCIFARWCAAATVACDGKAELDASVGGGEDVPVPTVVKELCAGPISVFELATAEDAGAMLGAILPPGADEAGGGLLLTGGTELGRGAAELLADATPVLLGRGGLDVCCTGGGAVSMAATV